MPKERINKRTNWKRMFNMLSDEYARLDKRYSDAIVQHEAVVAKITDNVREEVRNIVEEREALRRENAEMRESRDKLRTAFSDLSKHNVKLNTALNEVTDALERMVTAYKVMR